MVFLKEFFGKVDFEKNQQTTKQEGHVALNRSPVLIYVHQSCSVEGNDLNHLVEGNQAGLFECITRPYPLLPSHTIFFNIPNIKALALVVSDKKVFFMFSLDGSLQNM